MAQRTVVHFYSDISGDEIDCDDATVWFGLDGTEYEIELAPEEQQELRSALAPYIAAGRKVGSVTNRRRTSLVSPPGESDGATSKEVRAWAVANGYEVPSRGRIPAPVREAYETAR